MKRLAIIDIDGTMLPASLEHWFIKFLFKKGYITARGILIHFLTLCATQRRPRWYGCKLAYLRGFSEQRVEELIEECWSECIKPRLFTGLVAAVRWLQSNGHEVALLSGTPAPLARPLAHYLRVTRIICASPEIVDRHYSGRLSSPHPRGRVKLQIAETALVPPAFTWDRVIVFADHRLDRFLLARAACGIVVAPDRCVKKLARRGEWLVVENPQQKESVISLLEKTL